MHALDLGEIDDHGIRRRLRHCRDFGAVTRRPRHHRLIGGHLQPVRRQFARQYVAPAAAELGIAPHQRYPPCLHVVAQPGRQPGHAHRRPRCRAEQPAPRCGEVRRVGAHDVDDLHRPRQRNRDAGRFRRDRAEQRQHITFQRPLHRAATVVAVEGVHFQQPSEHAAGGIDFLHRHFDAVAPGIARPGRRPGQLDHLREYQRRQRARGPRKERRGQQAGDKGSSCNAHAACVALPQGPVNTKRPADPVA